MTSDGEKGSGPQKKASASRRPGPTIDLTATEVASEPPADAQAVPETPATEPEKTPEPQAEAASPLEADAGAAPPRAPERRSRSWWNQIPGGLPVALLAMTVAAGIVFFLLGLAAANLIVQREVAAVDRTQADNDLSERLSKIETTVEAALAAPPVSPPPLAPDTALIERIVAAEAAAKQATETAAAQQRRAEELATIAREAQSRSAAAMQAAEAAQKLSASSPEVSRSDIDALNTRIAALDQALKASEAELARRVSAATELDRKSRLVVVSSVLLNAVERGAPFTAELAAAKTLAPDMSGALAPLNDFAAAGLPASNALARELSALIPDLVKAERAQADKMQALKAQSAPQEESFLQKLQSNAERLVRIRPVGEVAGDQPVQVIARIEARAARGDVSGAAAELAALPPPVRAPAEAWIRKVGARDAALALARQFSTNALAVLGKPNP